VHVLLIGGGLIVWTAIAVGVGVYIGKKNAAPIAKDEAALASVASTITGGSQKK
jgi:hypothetical protein